MTTSSSPALSAVSRRSLALWAPLVAALLVPPGAGAQTKPPEIAEISAPLPKEISGVAAVPGGFAVVGDETGDHGRVWPSGATWSIDPRLTGPESLDAEFGSDGELHWFVLDENKRRLIDLDGGDFKLPKRFKEVCGRGAEGLAVRPAGDGTWDIAVLYEGGFYESSVEDPCDDPDQDQRGFTEPRVAILRWKTGEATGDANKQFDLNPPQPAAGLRFRAPDLAWNGDHLIVLLASLDKDDSPSGFAHTWLQDFDLEGNPVGAPIKLEDRWQNYRDRKNWEALDWTLDGQHLVMGYDSKKGSELAIFPWPYPAPD